MADWNKEMTGMERRDFLRLVSSGLPLSAMFLPEPGGAQATVAGQAAVGAQEPSGLIVRQRQPDNLESPFGAASDFITPNDRFYVRSHFAVPQLDARTWRLRVEGAVERPLDLSYQELLRLPALTRAVTLECAGNGRSFLTPPTKGVQWGLGAVSNAAWTGVPLGAILKQAGLRRDAVEVVLEGADSGEPKDPPKPTGPIHFARSLPLTREIQQNVLLAHQMNGATLPPAHGFPVRAVVPGWYGVASVKWLTRIVVTDRPFHGHFQTVDYAIWERSYGVPTRVPITEMLVKAEIARPGAADRIAAGASYLIHGAAWTGKADIAKVDVSADGGQTWNTAKLLGSQTRYAWRLWEYHWTAPAQPGSYTLLARATDTRGNTQEMQRQPDRENYLINHILPVPITVY
jgi:DMSO/TMAO reductase YedYZ molybdopterin-dependent catalytic subunit